MFSVLWNGAIYCITYANVHARFEVEEEKLIQTPMPRNLKILSHDKISIFQMHRDYCGWIVKYRGANEKDFTLVLAIRGKVISYNVKSKTLKELHDLSTDDLDDWGEQVGVILINSLKAYHLFDHCPSCFYFFLRQMVCPSINFSIFLSV
ncbi:hypothetical protein HYC85_004061 [Camellia sinensis]|uniref:Uncharacterized protein n=1 Tax=Camellia sinensis TaxID=4442 RepID=A0A7J7HXI9_CAMSI|nr:hypothetical protein HYC85_004061 [Camellia sinensis]